MAVDQRTLTKWWIQYLKSNRMVALDSDENGNLNYIKQPTEDDLKTFLDIKTEFTIDEINAAIKATRGQRRELQTVQKDRPIRHMMAPQAPQIGNNRQLRIGNSSNSQNYQANQPNNKSQAPNSSDDNIIDMPPIHTKVGHDKDSISDIDYKDVDGKYTKSSKNSKNKNKDIEDARYTKNSKIREAIKDDPDPAISEKDVESVFSYLASASKSDNSTQASSANSNNRNRNNVNNKPQVSPDDQLKKQSEDLRKMKRLIRDVMTDSQRKAFWRMLTDKEALDESQINNSDIRAIFKTASDTRNNPSGFGRIFKGLRKDKIDVNDLQSEWSKRKFPDDTRDITRLLKDHGFDDKEIKKVFGIVFGTSKDKKNEPDVPYQSDALLKFAKYAKENDLADDLISFMRDEYGFKESFVSNKLMIEDIRKIFTEIVKEKRLNREEMIMQEDKIFLGRIKK